jgi:hypothetical protein
MKRGLLADIVELAYPVLIDWKRCLAELRTEGWTPYRVAHHLGADPPTVYSWEQGSEPRHSYGAALLVLHRTICGIEYSEKLYSDARPRA